MVGYSRPLASCTENTSGVRKLARAASLSSSRKTSTAHWVEPRVRASISRLTRSTQQLRIDGFPGRVGHRGDIGLQRGFLGHPVQGEACECLKRGRVQPMERQLLVGQLTVLLEQRAAQCRLGGQSTTAGGRG